MKYLFVIMCLLSSPIHAWDVVTDGECFSVRNGDYIHAECMTLEKARDIANDLDADRVAEAKNKARKWRGIND